MRWIVLVALLVAAILGGGYAYYRNAGMDVEEAHHVLAFFMGQRLAAMMCDQLVGGVQFRELDRAIAEQFSSRIDQAEELRRREFSQLYGDQVESELRNFIRGEEEYFLRRTVVSTVFCRHYAEELRIRQKAGWEYIEVKWRR